MIGLGIDLCGISRVQEILEKHPGFLNRYFTEDEITYVNSRGKCKNQSAAAMLAAKEAFAKALGTGFAMGISPKDIAVLHEEGGRPFYSVTGVALGKMQELGAVKSFLSLTHEGDTAAAVCILE